MIRKKLLLAGLMCSSLNAMAISESNKEFYADEHIWLEDILGDKPLGWVKEQNKITVGHFEKKKVTKELTEQYMKLLKRKDKIRYGRILNDTVYNFYTDDEYPRGLLTRKSKKDYLNNSGTWETVLDIGALGKKENKSWVYKGSTMRKDFPNIALIDLSDGGQDATVTREFDLKTKTFVKGGFTLPESKSSASFFDEDTFLVADASSKETKTKIGYSRVIKLVKRGEDLSKAKVVFEGKESDVGAGAFAMETEEGYVYLIRNSPVFFEADYHMLDPKTLKLSKLPLPSMAHPSGVLKGSFLFQNQKPFEVDGAMVDPGSLIAFDFEEFKKTQKSSYTVLLKASKDFNIGRVSITKDYGYVVGMRDVKSEVKIIEKTKKGFEISDLQVPENGSIRLMGGVWEENMIQLQYESFTHSDSLYIVSEKDKLAKVQSQKTDWNSSNVEVSQHWVKSKDGTKVPYFMMHKKGLKLDGKNPTLLYGYGGFNNAMNPFYSEWVGTAWIERGGVYVLGNIRGGGEFGPEWHQSAKFENKHKSYDDFIAVGEDLVKRKVTSPKHLGIEGGSNGGLLVGAVAMRRPDLFNAVVCSAPLLDMLRYTLMENAKGDRVGQSWAGEYGDPVKDKKMEDYIKTYSPYQNIKKEQKYPKIFFMTSTKDDRVVPSHARKMAVKMQKMGHDVWFYENTEGGHSVSADAKQRAFNNAMKYSYLIEQLF